MCLEKKPNLLTIYEGERHIVQTTKTKCITQQIILK